MYRRDNGCLQLDIPTPAIQPHEYSVAMPFDKSRKWIEATPNEKIKVIEAQAREE
ncbi:hypothetical protein P167DRAFT_536331 [Morchella conica CCBAS932]|uniref:Uncharacterized protein n=1 Tax=Morchella conica CCBAS932 TaxID=1392247 RepID=A0A3N4KRM0_9PEZI|nr:hypothetical protein P167DRAFT_536331 [Morchella conica CCBAS932]